MTRALIGGLLGIISSMWAIALSVYTSFNLTDHWMNFRFIESAVQLGIIIPFAIAAGLLVISLLILVVEFIKNNY